MEKKPGYRTITYRFRLYCEPMVLLTETKKMYNQVLAFYYDVLRKEPELLQTPKLKLMRQLEVLTVGTKEQLEEDVKYPIPYEKVPLYFRRAAINDAIRLHLSFCSGEEQGAQMAEKFNASPIFYKGMYKEFNADSIRLKLYDRVAWKWVLCSIDTCGRNLPEEKQMLSPVIVLERGRAMLHVPVKEDVEDVRTVKERMTDTEKLCAVYFPKDDVLAVAVLLSKDGEFLESKFIRGGRKLMHKKQQLYQQILKNRQRMGGDRHKLPADENKALKSRIHRITEEEAHRASRELVDFCQKRNVSIIVVPKYGPNKAFTGSPYAIANSYDWIGRRILSSVVV